MHTSNLGSYLVFPDAVELGRGGRGGGRGRRGGRVVVDVVREPGGQLGGRRPRHQPPILLYPQVVPGRRDRLAANVGVRARRPVHRRLEKVNKKIKKQI